MERYIKPSVELMKVEVQAALLSLSGVGVSLTESNDNGLDLAPRRKDIVGGTSAYDVWSRWTDGDDEDGYAEYAARVEANR